jgi:hypothetical protein
MPETLRQGILGFEAPLRVAAATGGTIGGVGAPGRLSSGLSAMFSGAVPGGIGGFQIGRAMATPQPQVQAADLRGLGFRAALNFIPGLQQGPTQQSIFGFGVG